MQVWPGIPASDLLLELFVEGRIISQPRKQQGRGGHTIMAPAKHPIRSWRRVMRAAAERAMDGRKPYTARPLWITVVFRFPRPKRLPPDGPEPHFVDPDHDNVVKAMQDALLGVVWSDDCIISSASVRKCYAAPGRPPGVLLLVMRDDPSRWRIW